MRMFSPYLLRFSISYKYYRSLSYIGITSVAEMKRRKAEEALNYCLQSLEAHPPLSIKEQDTSTNAPTLISQLKKRQDILAIEAQSITLQLFRSCLVSVRTLAPSHSSVVSVPGSGTKDHESLFHPGQDFESRYYYYLEKIREGFYQDRDCLPLATKDECFPWRVHHMDRFVYLIQKGEEMRSWILTDYQVKDPCNCSILDRQKRLDAWKQDTMEHLKLVYDTRGWHFPLESESGHNITDDDDDDDDEKDLDDDSIWREDTEITR